MRHGRKLSFDEAYEEVVADSMEAILADGYVVQLMADMRAQDKTLWGKIRGWFRDLADKLKAMVSSYEDVKPDSVEGKLVSEMQDMIVILESFYTDALMDAGENYAARAQKNTADDGRVRYSFVGVGQGGIEIYETSEKVRNLSWKDRKKLFLQLMRNQYRGRTAKFVRNGHAYYAKFEYRDVSKNIYGDDSSDHKGLDAKINVGADGNIFELVENSKYSRSEVERGKNQRMHRGVNHWDYFVKTVQIDNAVFDLTANVRKKSNGEFVYVIEMTENKEIEPSSPGDSQYSGRNRVPNGSNQSIRNPREDVKPKMSTRDSTGRQLTEAQQEYFKDSKVRDEDGNLLVMYHGTPNGGYTRFHNGTYFTPSAEYATVYQSPGASSISVKSGASNPMNYEVYLNITKPFDTRNPKEREIFMKEYYRKYGTGAPLSESGLPDWTDGMDLQEFIEDMGYDYDGLILDEGATGGYGDEVKSRGLSYITFSSEQVKRVDNPNPTSNPDIRYSGRDNGGVEGYRKPAYERWDVEAALWDAMDHADRGQDNLIKVGNLPNLIVDKLGIEGDFYIYRNHAYENMVSEETARREGRYSEKAHYHGIGVDTMVEAVMSLEEPILTIATNTKDGNPAVMMVLPVMGKNNAPLYAVLSFYASRDINGAYERKPHVVLTVAERNYTEAGGRVGLLDIIENAIKDGRVISFDKEKRDYLSVNTKATSLGIITEQSLANNIARFRNEIKAYKEKNKITHSARTPTDTKIQHQLEQENESLREDVKYLREMLALQRKVTGGTKFTKTSVLAAARVL